MMMAGLLPLAGHVVFGESGASGMQSPAPTSATMALHEEPNWRAVCQEALATPLPPKAAVLTQEAAANGAPSDQKCDESTLY